MTPSQSATISVIILQGSRSAWEKTQKLQTPKEKNLRMRCNPHVIRAEPAIEPQHALILGHFGETIQHALVRQLAILAPTLLLQPRLDEIEGQTEETRKEAGNGTGRQRLRLHGHLRARLQLRLGFGKEGQLTEIQGHGPHDRWHRTRPQGKDSLVARYPHQRVHHALVIRPRLLRLQSVALHPDERQISRIAHHGRQPAGRQACRRPLFEADGRLVALRPRLQRRHESVEKPQASRRVHGLTQQSGTQPRIQIHHLARGDDVFCHGEGSRSRSGLHPFARELQPHLDHVDGLDDRRGRHSRQSTIDEGQRGFHVGVVEEGACARGRFRRRTRDGGGGGFGGVESLGGR